MDCVETSRVQRSCPLVNLSILAESDNDLLSVLTKLATNHLECNPAQFIYHAGTLAHAVYILHQGYVKLFKTTVGGKDQIIRIVKPGEVFGFDGLVAQHYNHSAVALRAAEICCIPVAALPLLGEHQAEIERRIMVRCIKALQHADERLLELGAKRSDERLASFLLEWCEGMGSERWIPLILSRLEIAQLLGLTIETVSRLFALWKREGIIKERHQAIQICAVQQLKTLALAH